MVIGEAIYLIISDNRDNLEYFMRSYKDSAYHNIMEWLDKKK